MVDSDGSPDLCNFDFSRRNVEVFCNVFKRLQINFNLRNFVLWYIFCVANSSPEVERPIGGKVKYIPLINWLNTLVSSKEGFELEPTDVEVQGIADHFGGCLSSDIYLYLNLVELVQNMERDDDITKKCELSGGKRWTECR